MRFKVIANHGESKSVFSVVDTQAPDDEQPCVVTSFTDREKANKSTTEHNEFNRVRSIDMGVWGRMFF